MPEQQLTMQQKADARGNALNAAKQFLESHPNVKIIITQWLDISGVRRSRMVPVERFLSLVASNSGFHQAVPDLLQTCDADFHPAMFEHFCAGRGCILPDVATLRPLSDGSGIGNTAHAIGEADLFDMDPRSNLRRLVKTAEEKHDLKFLIGFELEVCILEPGPSGGLAPAGPSVDGISLSSSTHRSNVWPVLNEAAIALAEAGIVVEQVTKEYGGSQWEFSLPPFAPVESVDAYVYAIETIRNIAHKHGLVASFYPKPDVGNGSGGTNGQHIHISATKKGDDGRSSNASWNPDELLSGILSHLPAMTAIGQAQLGSYGRVGAGKLATGGYVGWGDFHRDMPIRRIYKNHWELRTHDATSNPYAMVACMISACLDSKPLTIGNANGEFFLFNVNCFSY